MTCNVLLGRENGGYQIKKIMAWHSKQFRKGNVNGLFFFLTSSNSMHLRCSNSILPSRKNVSSWRPIPLWSGALFWGKRLSFPLRVSFKFDILLQFPWLIRIVLPSDALTYLKITYIDNTLAFSEKRCHNLARRYRLLVFLWRRRALMLPRHALHFWRRNIMMILSLILGHDLFRNLLWICAENLPKALGEYSA